MIDILRDCVGKEVEITFVDDTKMVGEITSVWAPPIRFTEITTETQYLLFPETIKNIKL
ncbi:hypothetical protein M4A92_15690 [Caldibacillus thermoamylovorans]|uniref:hypothetical protein n=1 Tax=Caldibacillus thermoamylovorans TaxID=35841 RepID=UPI002041DD05|nr:hypothetical protein [Caldibacillus thermoamylovorans]MCM3800037.1 hypothetical protein [Caldibacillus thermoamylovorans]